MSKLDDFKIEIVITPKVSLTVGDTINVTLSEKAKQRIRALMLEVQNEVLASLPNAPTDEVAYVFSKLRQKVQAL